MTAEPLPDWFMPPPGGWTADDLDRLPPGAPRVELIDGSLVLLSPHTKFHGKVMFCLQAELYDFLPDDVDIINELSVKLGKQQRPEPDLVVYRYDPDGEEEWHADTHVLPEEVLIAIEIVSEESKDRDRTTKPMKYAQAGIPHFWRVEYEDGNAAIHVYELDGTKEPRYVPVTVARKRLQLQQPFPIDLDVTSLAARPGQRRR
ncbi:Uma2 family endonuclease [Nocardiopsis sp. HNM0947]|uniref:Uma2 family endonuclease n=1 Tax=Nocardiopsis coralli TaxID=2772213 RepID=A0ABR9P920_9ACTN|nr:Uma2 family endonuclease [Nocardiopsis coralli]MBE3000337.1 Uma2 family endonuclease [Nocardiopsis coralli]